MLRLFQNRKIQPMLLPKPRLLLEEKENLDLQDQVRKMINKHQRMKLWLQPKDKSRTT